MSFDVSVPVLVIGGGACGAVAALAARDAGADVLLIEQDARPAGSTAMSQGLICAAGTRAQAALGIDDDAAIFHADIMAKSRGLADPVIARAIAEGSGPAMDWLVDRWDMPWQVDTAFRATYGNSRQRVHGWPGHGGADMVQLLHARLGEAGVDVLTQARLTEIIADPDGRVEGAVFARPDGAVERVGCNALILACGGFAANHAMVKEYMPAAAKARLNAHEGSRGDGIRLAERLGAAVGDMGSYQGYAMLTVPQGVSVPPGVLFEGGIIVNTEGERFVDETADIAGMAHNVLEQPDGMCWVLFDHDIEQRCAHIPETQALIALNAAKRANSVEALATILNLQAPALATTIAEAYGAQRQGALDAFGRIWGPDRPPVPPFRALRVTGALYHTQGGLQIDGAAHVLRRDLRYFPNLFAGGGTARSVSGPSSWGYLPAMGLCTAITLGRVAGTSAARLVR